LLICEPILFAMSGKSNLYDDCSNAPVFEPINVGLQLAFADGGIACLYHELYAALTPASADCVYTPLRRGEHPSVGIDFVHKMYRIPRFVKSALACTMLPHDAEVIRGFHRKSVTKERALVVKRNKYKQIWHDRWREEKLDFVLTVPAPIPGIPVGGMKDCGSTPMMYSFLFNIVSSRSLFLLLVN
jgi:hypothetical protein